MEKSGIKVIAENRKARFDYFLEDFTEGGLVLSGTEIKSIRNHSCNIKDSYILIKSNEAYVLNMHIAPYKEGNIFNHEEYRTRKVLLHKKEIIKLGKKIQEEGYTLVPTKVYLKNGLAKIEFALAKGKHNYDKREAKKQEDIKKELRKYNKEKY